MKKSKPYDIPKQVVILVFRRVNTNRGGVEINGLDLEEFEEDLKVNLNKIWNQMSSESYFSPPVKLVEKQRNSEKNEDLIFQQLGTKWSRAMVAMYLKPKVEPIFHKDPGG